jgi:hypothetical protein
LAVARSESGCVFSSKRIIVPFEIPESLSLPGENMALRLLHRAVVEDTKNPVLHEICYFVDRYNAEYPASRPVGVKSPTTLDAQASVLAGLFYRVASYLTSKHPQGGRLKRKLRWEALNELANQITAEAARVGVKLVRSSGNFRKTAEGGGNENIWLEVIDPLHRHAYTLSALYKKWLDGPGTKSFWEEIGGEADSEVEYHRGEQDMVSFAARRVVGEDGEPWTTRNGSTVFSGKGWQIFVFAPDGSLYIHDHAASEFHHTSFLGGGAVLAAGEIVVDDGWIRAITAKTGHYWTTPELMLNMVRRMPEIPDDAIVRPDVLDVKRPGAGPDGRDRMNFYTAADFRQNGLRATRLNVDEITDRLPGWATPTGFREQLYKYLAPGAKKGYTNPVT